MNVSTELTDYINNSVSDLNDVLLEELEQHEEDTFNYIDTKIENITNELNTKANKDSVTALETDMLDVKSKLVPSALVSTIRTSTEYKNDLDAKLNNSDFETYKTNSETKITELEELVSELEAKVAELEIKNTSLEEKNTTLEEKITSLEEKNIDLEELIAQLRTDVDGLLNP